MPSTYLRRAVAAGAVLAAVGALSAATVSTASAAGDDSRALVCQRGYVCLTEYGNPVVIMLPEGEARTFTPAKTILEVSNSTTVSYCIDANPNTGVAPGKILTARQTVDRIYPVPAGAACPL
ncbi:hypothetical protein [Streptomyces sp. NBC_01304]|uniref:hypothetical protein n=1 Tax=Streptomyces sp. NBC_01304 TaxID=2903818 RepID=UPI002E1431DC|nr:hypothetical protein OG430_16970 [Streptomyces sp. NBC_01304]